MEASEQAPTVGDVAQGPQPVPTPADILRAGYQRAQANRAPKDLVIPGYGEPTSELHVLYRSLDDYEELREELRSSINGRGLRPGQLELEVGKKTLLAASTGSYALIGGQKHDMGAPLGLALYDQLFPPVEGVLRPQTDGEALVLLFHSKTTLIMTAYTELDMWIKRGGQDSEEEALGE